MRQEFPNPVKRAADERSGGICECHLLTHIPGFSAEGCGCPVGEGNRYYEHVNCDGNGGEPTLDNCAVLTKTCWSRKTGVYDRPLVKKTKRLRDKGRGIMTGRAAKRRPMDGSRKSGWKKPMNGPAERRV